MVKITKKKYLCLVLTGRSHFFQCVLGGDSDGTFDVRALLFEQVYVVCGYNQGFIIPCIYTPSIKKRGVNLFENF